MPSGASAGEVHGKNYSHLMQDTLLSANRVLLQLSADQEENMDELMRQSQVLSKMTSFVDGVDAERNMLQNSRQQVLNDRRFT